MLYENNTLQLFKTIYRLFAKPKIYKPLTRAKMACNVTGVYDTALRAV